jgi:hypothetical protein
VTPVLVALAVIVVAGAVSAAAAATPRAAVLGLLVALLGAAYIGDPIPGPLGLLARVVGTTLGVYLVWIALRRAPGRLPAASAGWLGSAAIAVAGFVAGFLAAGGLGAALDAASGPGGGSGTAGVDTALVHGSLVARAAVAAAFALIALAVPQVALPRDTLRLGTGCLLLLAAAGLVGNALVGQLDAVVELALAVLTALAGAGAAAVIASSIRHGGDLVIHDALRPAAAVRHRASDDAHPVGMAGPVPDQPSATQPGSAS